MAELGLIARLRCPHSNLRGIYGDEINRTGGKRLLCMTCGSYLNGPAALAKIREAEWGEIDIYTEI